MNKKFVKSIRFTEIGAPSPCARPTRRANNNSPIREEQRQQPHFAQPTSVLLFPLLPKVPTTLLGERAPL